MLALALTLVLAQADITVTRDITPPMEKVLGSCDAHGKCEPGHVETCRLHGAEKAKRTDRMKREFKRRFPCPTTGKIQRSCPGWEIDHLIPLCCGGKDEWTNARWLEHDLHKLRHADSTVDCTGFPPVAK